MAPCGSADHSDQYGPMVPVVAQALGTPKWPQVAAWHPRDLGDNMVMVNADPNCGRTTDSDMALGSSPCHDATLAVGGKQVSIPTHSLPPSLLQSCLFPQHMNHSVPLFLHISNTLVCHKAPIRLVPHGCFKTGQTMRTRTALWAPFVPCPGQAFQTSHLPLTTLD